MTNSDESPHDEGTSADDTWVDDLEALTTQARTHLHRNAALGQIPGYEIRERIARGGQGVVYAAVDRNSSTRVAVKILSDALSGQQRARRRFERETEVVADLDHPNIISSLECGTTESGLPYLVMPHVQGIPLDRWAAELRTAGKIAAIIRLFVELCETVHFAHQRGVIHRDLKPGNVLIDETGQPRVLDFGLAKFTDQDDLRRCSQTMTQEDHFVGSLPWTSPEQLGGDSCQVDVRTDTYALGVMLYQALTGAFPYRVEGKLTTVVHSVMNIAPQRPGELNTTLSGDLDAIALKALAKSPEARYQSASEFAQDLQCCLDGEPIRARREQTRRALGRVVRRYQVATLVGTVLLAAIAWLYVQAAADRDRAEVEVAKSRASAQFLQDLFADVDPRKRGIDVTMAELLDQAASEIPERFGDQPEVAATLEFMLGRAYSHIGLRYRSAEHLERAWHLRRTTLGEDDLDTLEAEFYFSGSHTLSKEQRVDLMQHVAEERRRQLGPDAPPTLRAELYLLLWDGGQADTARLDDLVSRASTSPQGDERLLHQLVAKRVAAEFHYGNLQVCMALCRKWLAQLESHPDPDYEHRMGISGYLARALLVCERPAEAGPLIEYVVEVKSRLLGPEHPATFGARITKARWLLASGDADGADAELEPMFEAGFWQPSHLPGQSHHAVRAEVHSAEGRHDESIAELRRLLAALVAEHGADDPRVRREECMLVFAWAAAGRCAEATELAEPLLKIFQDHPLADHILARLRLVHAECLLALGEQDAARPHVLAAQAACLELFEPHHSLCRRADALLASLSIDTTSHSD